MYASDLNDTELLIDDQGQQETGEYQNPCSECILLPIICGANYPVESHVVNDGG